MTKRLSAVAAAIVVATAVAACGSESQEAPPDLRAQVEVTGEIGAKPSIEIDAPLEVSESTSWVTQKGSGDRVTDSATTILQLTLADGRTGKTVISTYDQGQRPLESALGPQMFPSLVAGLTGQRAGSRVVVASSPEDAYGSQGAPQLGIEAGDPVVMVADVLSTDPTSVLDSPTGATTPLPATLPKVLEEGGVPSGFDVKGLSKPRKLQVAMIRQGTGPAIEPPDRVSVDYVGQVWGQAKPFENSFTTQPSQLSIGLGGVIPAWDQAFPGMKEGARFLMVIPPKLGYGAEGSPPTIPGGSTLVFLVDVRGVG